MAHNLKGAKGEQWSLSPSWGLPCNAPASAAAAFLVCCVSFTEMSGKHLHPGRPECGDHLMSHTWDDLMHIAVLGGWPLDPPSARQGACGSSCDASGNNQNLLAPSLVDEVGQPFGVRKQVLAFEARHEIPLGRRGRLCSIVLILI